MTVFHLGTENADRKCDECAAVATAYVHGVGFRCGECHEAAPETRRRSAERQTRTVSGP